MMASPHPGLFRRLVEGKAKRTDMKIIVIDPRRTDTCSIADLHMAITPGSDVALFHAMLNVMVWDGLADLDYIERHTEGFGLLKQRIHEFTPRAAEDICGVPAADILQCAHWFGRSEEHTSELQSLMRNSYAVFCLKKKIRTQVTHSHKQARTQQ